LLLLTFDILFQFRYSYKKFENRFVGGARQFPALWLFAEGLFIFINYFIEKEGFIILRVEYTKKVVAVVL
jgi:hypothetical protein